MSSTIIDQVGLALFASDGMKIATPGTTIQESWERTPEKHTVPGKGARLPQGLR